MDSLKMQECTSCGRHIKPNDHGVVRFGCPSCDKVQITRCGRCRGIGNPLLCQPGIGEPRLKSRNALGH